MEAGVSVLPLSALDLPEVRLHYRYAHELTGGTFREHEVGASGWLQLPWLHAVHLGAEGTTRFTRLTSTQTGRSRSGSIRIEVFWGVYD
ncbi:hypothetical protein [Myxococcus landrumensis]|uniref:Uncharacterized protein n=1 Tax=Myxococcus landrumensis TaxID=2813577 RepID=A0ABX7NAF8_9BACT|nr:hypothetical protein [Myxococcus landrumus]QSQ15765.1 hypothetical protein JY572_06800 [Myxococcus landrumus]